MKFSIKLYFCERNYANYGRFLMILGAPVMFSCVPFELPAVTGEILSKQTLSNVQERELPKESNLRRSQLLQKLGSHCVSVMSMHT